MAISDGVNARLQSYRAAASGSANPAPNNKYHPNIKPIKRIKHQNQRMYQYGQTNANRPIRQSAQSKSVV